MIILVRLSEGDPQQDLFTVYQMNFIRKHGSQTENNVQDEAVSDHCPNCGAPLKISAISQCEYCGAELTRSPNQWVLIPMKLLMKTNYITREEIMDLFVPPYLRRLNSFNDSKFKRSYRTSNNLTADAFTINSTTSFKRSRWQSRQKQSKHWTTNTDGSVVIVPQGYVAILVNNGTFLGDVA